MRYDTPALAVLGIILLSGATIVAADAERNEKKSYLDADEAGPDFQIQGEYEASSGEKKLGAQVIALGDGKFDAVVYAGGLPGAGWDGDTKYRLSGKTEGDATQLEGEAFNGDIEDGKLRISDDDGKKHELKKVDRKSPTLAAKPPAGALVLFDGSGVEQWEDGTLTDDNLLGVGTRTKQKFRDFTLHLEFRTPFMPYARGQARGNSGMYLLDQYECQVLDSFGLEGEDNECGGIYQIARPDVNMCLPPLSWQTYDVEFRAARFNDAGEKVENAVTTIRHNGVVIHDNLELDRPTPGGRHNDEKPGALFLQDHRDPVRYRNIWVVEK